MPQELNDQPVILVDTENLKKEEWLAYRRRGIGGSDAAAVLGISPFRTARDLYYDKLNIVTADDNDNWVTLEVGHLLEPLVARIFAYKTGLKIYRRMYMFQHPRYPWMLADLDYLVELPDGGTAILECKTTNYNAKDKWWYNGEEIVPVYYEAQGRHYMAVMNVDRVYFCCLYGNNEDEAIIRRIDRDMNYESELIAIEKEFWNDHVLAQVPPPYTEDGDLIMESLRRRLGPADKDAPAVLLDQLQAQPLYSFLELQEEKRRLSAEMNQIEDSMKRMKGLLVEKMGTSCMALYDGAEGSYAITYNPVRTVGIPKAGLERLKLEHPDIYEEYVTVSESRRFSIKKIAQQAA
jgi:putative phage-type endonuclease